MQITSPNLPLYKNTLNSFRDKGKTILSGQQRLSRFGATILAPTGSHYTYELGYTGTAPQKQRFALADTQSGVIVHIKYTEQNSYSVRKESGGGIIEMNDYDKTIMMQKLINKFECGENRYVGVENILEFYISPGCSLIIEPRNVVLA